MREVSEPAEEGLWAPLHKATESPAGAESQLPRDSSQCQLSPGREFRVGWEEGSRGAWSRPPPTPPRFGTLIKGGQSTGMAGPSGA